MANDRTKLCAALALAASHAANLPPDLAELRARQRERERQNAATNQEE